METDQNHALPAHAFREAYPPQLPQGAVFKFRTSWAMRVAYSERNSDQRFLMLQGAEAGQLHRLGSGMAQALTLSDAFTWLPFINLGNPAASGSPHTAGLAIADVGPLLVGGELNGDGGHDAFDLTGKHFSDYSAGAITRFDQWAAQLALVAEPFRSLGTIFSVDRHVHST